MRYRLIFNLLGFMSSAVFAQAAERFTPEQLEFVKDVEAFLDEHDDPEIFDVTRENMAQIVDTPRRREFMAELSKKGWLGITWPEEYGGQDGDGVYEYLLNEALAARGGPQIGKGVGIIGKTLITHGSQKRPDLFSPWCRKTVAGTRQGSVKSSTR